LVGTINSRTTRTLFRYKFKDRGVKLLVSENEIDEDNVLAEESYSDEEVSLDGSLSE